MTEARDVTEVVRRIRNAAHELATALIEAERAKVPVRLRERISTVALKSSQVARMIEKQGQSTILNSEQS